MFRRRKFKRTWRTRFRRRRFRRHVKGRVPRRRLGARRMRRRKAVLSVSSVKKRAPLNCASNVAPGSSGVPSGTTSYSSSAVIASGNYTFFVFCPTARKNIYDSTSLPANRLVENMRSSSTIFVRGYREDVFIESSSADSWEWRRIVFAAKGPVFNQTNVSDTSPVNADWLLYNDATHGYVRLCNPLIAAGGSTGLGYTAGQLESQVFRGAYGYDYGDWMTAPIETNNVTLLYDKVRKLSSTTNTGSTWRFKEWFPINKNLRYNEEPTVEHQTSSYFSTMGKEGIGDIYVLDFFVPNSFADDVYLQFQPQGQLYWHEK